MSGYRSIPSPPGFPYLDCIFPLLASHAHFHACPVSFCLHHLVSLTSFAAPQSSSLNFTL